MRRGRGRDDPSWEEPSYSGNGGECPITRAERQAELTSSSCWRFLWRWKDKDQSKARSRSDLRLYTLSAVQFDFYVRTGTPSIEYCNRHARALSNDCQTRTQISIAQRMGVLGRSNNVSVSCTDGPVPTPSPGSHRKLPAQCWLEPSRPNGPGVAGTNALGRGNLITNLFKEQASRQTGWMSRVRRPDQVMLKSTTTRLGCPSVSGCSVDPRVPVRTHPATWPRFSFCTHSFQWDGPTTVGSRWILPVHPISIHLTLLGNESLGPVPRLAKSRASSISRKELMMVPEMD